MSLIKKQKRPKNSDKIVGSKIHLVIYLLVIICSFVLSFWLTYVNTKGYLSADLRNRIVGARVVSSTNPYFYKWRWGDSEEFLDPLDPPLNQVSRLSVSPFLLMFHLPLAKLAYPAVVEIWFLIQWLLFFSCLLLVLRYQKYPEKLATISLASIYSLSIYWWDHVIVGQVYVIFAFLLILLYLAYKRSSKWLGVILALLVLLKPTYLIGILLLSKSRKSVLPFVVTLIMGFILPVILVRSSIWIEYFQSLKVYSQLSLSEMAGYSHPDFIFKEIDGVVNDERAGAFIVPITSLRYYIKNFGIDLGSSQLLVFFSGIIAALGISLHVTRKKLSLNTFFVLAVLMCFLSDFFSPVPRFAYYEMISYGIVLILALIEKWRAIVFFVMVLTLTNTMWLIHAWLGNVILIACLIGWMYSVVERYSKNIGSNIKAITHG